MSEEKDPTEEVADLMAAMVKQAQLEASEHAGLRATVILCHKFMHAGQVELAQEVLCYATLMLMHEKPDEAWSEDLSKRVTAANTDLATVECKGHA